MDIPKWDPALENLIKDEFSEKGDKLVLQDFLELARKHAIRFDDIMVTVFELCINGLWKYTDANGIDVAITRDTVNKLYVNGRLRENDLQAYSGGWSILKG